MAIRNRKTRSSGMGSKQEKRLSLTWSSRESKLEEEESNFGQLIFPENLNVRAHDGHKWVDLSVRDISSIRHIGSRNGQKPWICMDGSCSVSWTSYQRKTSEYVNFHLTKWKLTFQTYFSGGKELSIHFDHLQSYETLVNRIRSLKSRMIETQKRSRDLAQEIVEASILHPSETSLSVQPDYRSHEMMVSFNVHEQWFKDKNIYVGSEFTSGDKEDANYFVKVSVRSSPYDPLFLSAERKFFAPKDGDLLSYISRIGSLEPEPPFAEKWEEAFQLQYEYSIANAEFSLLCLILLETEIRRSCILIAKRTGLSLEEVHKEFSPYFDHRSILFISDSVGALILSDKKRHDTPYSWFVNNENFISNRIGENEQKIIETFLEIKTSLLLRKKIYDQRRGQNPSEEKEEEEES